MFCICQVVKCLSWEDVNMLIILWIIMMQNISTGHFSYLFPKERGVSTYTHFLRDKSKIFWLLWNFIDGIQF